MAEKPREDFPLECLPYGSIKRSASAPPRLCVALNRYAIELGAIAPRLEGVADELVDAPNLDRLLAADSGTWARLREGLSEVLASAVPSEARISLDEAIPCLPFTVADYADFYSSIQHATNVGRLFRPDAEPLLANWRRLPVGYHGRSSTVVVSGTPITRPFGQRAGAGGPSWGATTRLDIELELACVIGGPPNALGEPVPIDQAAERIFGFVLLNDWSARDIQAFENQPLGPFLGKSFATSISAWVVPLPALAPARVYGPTQEPEPFEYLRTTEPWALDIDLEVALTPVGDTRSHRVARGNARELYWSAAQQLTHAASNGAIVRPGDLYGSGTISGWEPGTQGCLLELTRNGARALQLGDVTRTFLEDGDTVTLAGWTSQFALGEVRGTVLPAKPA